MTIFMLSMHVFLKCFIYLFFDSRCMPFTFIYVFMNIFMHALYNNFAPFFHV